MVPVQTFGMPTVRAWWVIVATTVLSAALVITLWGTLVGFFTMFFPVIVFFLMSEREGVRRTKAALEEHYRVNVLSHWHKDPQTVLVEWRDESRTIHQRRLYCSMAQNRITLYDSHQNEFDKAALL